MKETFNRIIKVLGLNGKDKKSEELDFWWKLEKTGENEYVFESYGQKTQVKKYDELKFNIWGIIDTEKHIKFIADFINHGKQIAAEWSMNDGVKWTSFSSYKDFPDTNIDVVFHIENDVEPEEMGDEYESWYWSAKSIIEKKTFNKMSQSERYLINKNKSTIEKYLNDRAKEKHINEMPVSTKEIEA